MSSVVRQRRAKKPAAPPQESESSEGGPPPQIKWKFVWFIVLLVGLPTIVPAALWIGGAVAPSVQQATSRVGAQLGLVATPRARLVKFYEKHNSAKVAEVPAVLKKYSGEYPKMIKILEAKYHDYGFFLGWERDNDLKMDKYWRLARYYYRRHVPIKVRMALYRMYSIVYSILEPAIDLVRSLIKSIYY